MMMSPARQQLAELVDGGLGDPPAGTIIQTTRGAASFSTSSARLATSEIVRVAVVADDLVPGGAQPLAHVAAHPAEADKAELHGVPPQ